MEPTSVPTYSTEIGTSRSTTGSTFTTAGGGGAVAREASPQPAAVIATSPISETPSRARTSIMWRFPMRSREGQSGVSSGAEGGRSGESFRIDRSAPLRRRRRRPRGPRRPVSRRAPPPPPPFLTLRVASRRSPHIIRRVQVFETQRADSLHLGDVLPRFGPVEMGRACLPPLDPFGCNDPRIH